MRIPSYDDLTPSIPDVSPLDVFASAERLMPAAPPVAEPERQTAVSSAASDAALFACLYTVDHGQRPTDHEHPTAPSAAARERLSAIAQAFSPRFERYGETAVAIDVSGLGRLLGDAQTIGAELERTARAAGGRTQVAVAPTQTGAMLLAMARPSLTVVTSDIAAAIAPLPLALLQQLVRLTPLGNQPTGAPRRATAVPRSSRLSVAIRPDPGPRIPDPGSRTFDTLRRWGLTTIGELAALPPTQLAERLGADGPALYRRANGIDPRPLVPDPAIPRFLQSMELEWPIESLEPLSFVLARLLEPLSASLERADRGAAAVRLDLRLTNQSTHARVLQLPAPMRDPRVLRTLLQLDLESNPPAAAIDVVTIEVDPAPARIVQYSLLERATIPPETIATLTARLHALVGESRCGTPVIVDTHRPDGFQMWQFAGSLGSAGASGSTGSEGSAGSGGSRDSSAHGAVMLRRFRPPVAVRVAVGAGRPVRVAIERRGMPGGHVEQFSGPWRSSGGWWEAGGHWDRDEWDVALSDGSLCRIYRDRVSGVWFLEGIFD